MSATYRWCPPPIQQSRFSLFYGMVKPMTDSLPLLSSLDYENVVTLRQRLAQLEMQLIQVEEKSQAQFKAIPVPTYIWGRVRDDFVLQDYNDAAVTITQGKIQEYLGITAGRLYEEQPEIRAEMERCFLDRRNIKREMTYEFKSTGEEHYLSVSYTFVPPDQVMVHTDDITEETQTLRQLQASEAKYRNLFENAQVGTFRSRMDGSGLIEVNRSLAEMLGCSVEEMSNRPVSFFWSDSQSRQSMLEELRHAGRLINYETSLQSLSGEPRICLISASFDIDSDILQGTVVDITDRKKAEQELDRQAKALTETNIELQRFNKMAVGREMRMIELKQEVNELAHKLGQPPPYDLSFTQGREQGDSVD